MRVLVGCEESGKVRDAFIDRGHDAVSNDLEPARTGGPHLQKCVKLAIVEDGPWDIIILHPDCTTVSVSGNPTYGLNKDGSPKPKHHMRLAQIEWVDDLWKLAKKHARIGAALENPVSMIWKRLGKPQYYHPWHFGHKEVKATGILVDRLPPLLPTKNVGPAPKTGTEERKSWEVVWRMARSATKKRDRSETKQGLADAMADQWGDLK